MNTEQIFWMIGIASWAWISVLLFIATFIFYLAVLKMRDSNKDLIWRAHWPVRWTGFAILFVGLILDTVLNWVVMTILMLELPREFLTTARVARHKNYGSGWRKSQAKYWCENWLQPFDAGHCD